MNIREARREDVPGLLALYRHLNPGDPPVDPQVAARELDRIGAYAGSAILLACDGAVIVGSVTAIVIPNLSRGGAPYMLIENVVTHADHRRKGIGKALLANAATRAWSVGCYKVMLMTGSTREATLGFYRVAGFEQTKTGFQMRQLPPRDDN